MTPTTATDGNDFNVPKGEIAWVRGCDSDGSTRYVITSNQIRNQYFLYACENGEWKKIAKARSPIAFEGRVKLK